MPPKKISRLPRKDSTLLNPGDTVELALTAEIKNLKHGNWWIKAGGSTTVRPDEDGNQAMSRLSQFVAASIEEQVKEITT